MLPTSQPAVFHMFLRYTTWCKSKPLSAANQKPIFDSLKEAEMVQNLP